MTLPAAARGVLDFWFGDVEPGGHDALEAANRRWFGGGKTFDAEIRARFGEQVEAALAGGLHEWERNIQARLALVIVLDQFTRNIFRGSERAFAGDDRALALAQDAVASGTFQQLSPIESVFLLMPYQHSEDRTVQEESVRLFAALARAAPYGHEKMLQKNLEYAKRHHDIVVRFGRYPHRNAALGRETTPDEAKWLETGESFGQ